MVQSTKHRSHSLRTIANVPIQSNRESREGPTLVTHTTTTVAATIVPKEVIPQCSFTQWSRYSSSPRNTRRSIPVQNAPTRSHTNPERGQLAPKPVDVFGPSAPRTHVAAFTCPVAASGSCAVCARRCALPPAVSPLGRAPCSVALPSLAG